MICDFVVIIKSLQACSINQSVMVLNKYIVFSQQIASYIKRATGRHNNTAVISLFPVLKHLRSIKPAFDVTLEVGTPSTILL